ncbi:MAG: hypothetical protein VX640_01030 [Pseudomonadota bacterium]|nr:hypothetical protein [Pseudomonadota bacterium]
MTLQEAFIIVGAFCIVAGLFFRDRGVSNRGLSLALIVVGALCAIAGPAGRRLGVW